MNNLESKAKAWEEILQHVLDKDSGRYYTLLMDSGCTPVEAVIVVLEGNLGNDLGEGVDED